MRIPERVIQGGYHVEMGRYLFVISLVAALFGFTGIAAGAAEVAKVLFYIFLGVFALFLILGLTAVQKLRT